MSFICVSDEAMRRFFFRSFHIIRASLYIYFNTVPIYFFFSYLAASLLDTVVHLDYETSGVGGGEVGATPLAFTLAHKCGGFDTGYWCRTHPALVVMVAVLRTQQGEGGGGWLWRATRLSGRASLQAGSCPRERRPRES